MASVIRGFCDKCRIGYIKATWFNMINRILMWFNLSIHRYKLPEEFQVKMIMKQVRKKTIILLTINDAFFLTHLVQKITNGKIIEIGTARGGSALLINAVKNPNVQFYTITPLSTAEETAFTTNLMRDNNINFYNGIYPQDFPTDIESNLVQMYHVDTDNLSDPELLNRITKYIMPGGFILIHDYGTQAFVNNVREKLGVFLFEHHDEFITIKPPATSYILLIKK